MNMLIRHLTEHSGLLLDLCSKEAISLARLTFLDCKMRGTVPPGVAVSANEAIPCGEALGKLKTTTTTKNDTCAW